MKRFNHTTGKLTREAKEARRRAYDLQRYEATMRAKREHEAKYGPMRQAGELRVPAPKQPRLYLVE